MNIYPDFSSSLSDFISVNIRLNKDNPNYIRPLDKDIAFVFDSSKNKLLKTGKICRWLLRNSFNEPIGRIAAFINPRYKNKGDKFRMGGIGFFDCIDNQKAANLLFDTAKEWLQEQGMEAMDGPINFGERDKWWGLLVEGFHAPPYRLNYNPQYYQQLFELYGFKNFYAQICYKLLISSDSNNQLSEKFYRAHDKFKDNPEYKAVHLRKKNMEKFAKDFCEVYNAAWASHAGNKTISNPQAIATFKALKPIADEKLVWFVYHKDRPVAVWFNIPDINQIIKQLNGQFHLLEKIKFFILKLQKVCKNVMGIVFGVIPEYQSTGIDYFMIVEAEKEIKKNTGYRELELQWQGEFNPKIHNISKNLEAEKSRTLITYRYIFDHDAVFERHPIL